MHATNCASQASVDVGALSREARSSSYSSGCSSTQPGRTIAASFLGQIRLHRGLPPSATPATFPLAPFGSRVLRWSWRSRRANGRPPGGISPASWRCSLPSRRRRLCWNGTARTACVVGCRQNICLSSDDRGPRSSLRSCVPRQCMRQQRSSRHLEKAMRDGRELANQVSRPGGRRRNRRCII